MRIIGARCGDVLSDDDLAALMEPDLPVAAIGLVMDVLDQMMDRLAALVKRTTTPTSEATDDSLSGAKFDRHLLASADRPAVQASVWPENGREGTGRVVAEASDGHSGGS